MSRIKVLQVGKFYHPYKGGAETHLFTLANELKKKVEVEVLSVNTGFKTSIEKYAGINIYRVASIGTFFSLPITLSLPFWLMRRKADILHFHLPNPVSIFSYFCARPKGKLIVSYHSDIVRQRAFNFLMAPFLIRFLKKAEAIIVTSDKFAENSSILKKFKDKCRVVPHGIDTGRFKSSRLVLKESMRIKQKYGGPLILFVGRLVYYKGLKYLLPAMRHINGRLLIIGDGPLRNRLKRLARRLKVEDKIVWFGKIEDTRLVFYYYACDIFVLPSSSRAESFGIVQLETFACGRPVVSTNLPTTVPLVNVHGKTGLIVPPKDSISLASAINTLLKSPELQKIYGENGKERVKKVFGKERMAREVLRIYESILPCR